MAGEKTYYVLASDWGIRLNKAKRDKPGIIVYSTSLQRQTVEHSAAALQLYESASAGLKELSETLAVLLNTTKVEIKERLQSWRVELSPLAKQRDFKQISIDETQPCAQLLIDEGLAYFCIPLDQQVELILSGETLALRKLIDNEEIERLLPHICQAMSLCQKLSRQKHDLDSVYQVLLHYPIPALAVDNHLNTVFVNRMLEQTLSGKSVQQNNPQMAVWQEKSREYIDLLKICDTSHQRLELKHALQKCTQTDQSESVLCRLSIEGTDYPIIVSSLDSVPSLFRHYARSNIAWVYLLDASYASHLKSNRFFQDMELSKTEKELCVLLFEGKYLGEIAELRSVSDQTVRKQLQSVLRKTQLECQEELIIYLFRNCIEYGLVK